MKLFGGHFLFLIGVLGGLIALPGIASARSVTVTAVVMAEQGDGTAWDLTHGADIILCGAAGCYVSNGLDEPATFYEGRGAFRLLKKAGACRDSLKCVFRGVDLEKLQGDKSFNLQLVDVDYVSHNYMTLAKVRAKSNCSVNSARLECGTGVHERDYSLWVIDEEIAKRAGKAGLDHALFKGVQAQRTSALIEKLKRHRAELSSRVSQFYKLILQRDVPEHCSMDKNFLSETFYVMGLADASKRRAEYILKEMIGRKPASDLSGLIRNKPQLFWAFIDVAAQFRKFAAADQSEQRAGIAELEIETVDGRDKLLYGWRAEARAKAAFEVCNQTAARLEKQP